jgi:pilus assembly protein CpaB
MTRRRRAVALLGLALLLGVLAASDVAGREAALRRQLGPTVPVVVVRAPLRAGDRITRGALALRLVPERYAPASAFHEPAEAVGRRAGVPIAAGADLGPALLRVPGSQAQPAGPALRRGERALDLVAVGAAAPGTRVDVLVTDDGRGGATRLVLAGAEVLATRPAQAPDAQDALPRVVATLRVTVRQAVALTAAAAGAREVRLLARP